MQTELSLNRDRMKKIISLSDIQEGKKLEESILKSVKRMEDTKSAEPWQMKRSIDWVSNCWDEIELVYEKCENKPAFGNDLMNLEQKALEEAQDACSLVTINGKHLTSDKFIRMSAYDKEKVMYLLGDGGLKELTLSYREPLITVTFNTIFPWVKACTMFNLLNRLEKLDGSYNIVCFPNQKMEMALRIPVGGRKDILQYEMMITKFYPWIGRISETSIE